MPKKVVVLSDFCHDRKSFKTSFSMTGNPFKLPDYPRDKILLLDYFDDDIAGNINSALNLVLEISDFCKKSCSKCTHLRGITYYSGCQYIFADTSSCYYLSCYFVISSSILPPCYLLSLDSHNRLVAFQSFLLFFCCF